MKRRNKVALTTAAIVGVLVFFAGVPVVYWYTAYFPGFVYPNIQPPLFSVYRSLSCVVLGVGVTYQTGGWHGLQGVWYVSCHPPILIPL